MAAASTVVLQSDSYALTPTGHPRMSFSSHADSEEKKSRTSRSKSVFSERKDVGAPMVVNSTSYLRRTDEFSVPWVQRNFPQLARLVLSRNFEIFIGLIIMINCAILGIEAEILLGRAESLELLVDILENTITAIFVIEIVLRVLICGFTIYVPVPGNLLNIFDALLVFVTGVVAVWIMPLLSIESHDSLRALNVLRAFRLARLVRVLANFEVFHEVWLLLRGLMESGRVLFWTIVVIFIITYIFAIFGVTLLSIQIKDEYENIVDPIQQAGSDLKELIEVTSGVLPLMYTLIQVLTLDSWNGIARPMMKYIPWCWVYFYGYIAIAVIVMMNLVTAVIVDNALKNSQKDANDLLKQRERQKQAKLAHFRQVFEDMDIDGNGELSWPEFESAYEDEVLSNELRLLGIEPDKCQEIFNLLDSGDGVLSIEEFFDGLHYMEGGAHAKDLLRANRQIELIIKLLCQQNQELREDLDELLRATPGARCVERKGTFRSRAGRRPQSDGIDEESRQERTRTVSITSGLSKLSNTGTPSNVSKTSNIFENGDGMTLGDAVGRLEQFIGSAIDSRNDIRHSVDACTTRVDACSQEIESLMREMDDFKKHLTYDYVVSLDKEKKARPVTPKSQWRKDVEAQLPKLPGLPSSAELARTTQEAALA